MRFRPKRTFLLCLASFCVFLGLLLLKDNLMTSVRCSQSSNKPDFGRFLIFRPAVVNLHENLTHEEFKWHEGEKVDWKFNGYLDMVEFRRYLTHRKVSRKDIAQLKNILYKNGHEKDENNCRNQAIAAEKPETGLRKLWISRGRRPGDSWERFYDEIGSCDVYRDFGSDPTVGQTMTSLLHDMLAAPIKLVKNMKGGTQMKLEITFSNGHKAVLKPMRFSRNYETPPDQFYFTDFERHQAEIAVYHLDKILGFRRALPITGRLVDMRILQQRCVDKNLSRVFFTSPAKSFCLAGLCKYYCDTTHAICGKPYIETSMQVFLPRNPILFIKSAKSPFKRTYNKRNHLAEWQLNPNHCNLHLKNSSGPQYLLDMVDLSILDFLSGNQDRHHHEKVKLFSGSEFLLHVDNGRAFGRSDFDDLDILAPLTQCCLLKSSTLSKLISLFYEGQESLAEKFNKSMSNDPLAPILAEKHLLAVERRLEILLGEIHRCIFVKNFGEYRRVIFTK